MEKNINKLCQGVDDRGVIKVDTVSRVQIYFEAIHISHIANILGKGMNPTIIHLAMSK